MHSRKPDFGQPGTAKLERGVSWLTAGFPIDPITTTYGSLDTLAPTWDATGFTSPAANAGAHRGQSGCRMPHLRRAGNSNSFASLGVAGAVRLGEGSADAVDGLGASPGSIARSSAHLLAPTLAACGTGFAGCTSDRRLRGLRKRRGTLCELPTFCSP